MARSAEPCREHPSPRLLLPPVQAPSLPTSRGACSSEGSSERRRAGMLLERYTALPFASLPRGWTRFAISAILLLVLSLSALVAYEVGIETSVCKASVFWRFLELCG